MTSFINALQNIPADQLHRAIAVKEKIDELEREFASILGQVTPSGRVAPSKVKIRKRISAAGRARMARAARKRWRRARKQGRNSR